MSKRKENPALTAILANLHGTGLQPARPSVSGVKDGPVIEASAATDPSGTGASLSEPRYLVINKDFRSYVGQVVEIPIEKLRVEDNVRTQIIEDDDFEGLVETIRVVGLIQNLYVQLSILPDGSEDLLLVAGQRRWAAAGKAGRLTVPCYITEGLDQKTRLLLGLIENVTRKELTTIDTAFAYGKLIELGSTQQELADIFTCHKKTIQRYLNLTTWPQAAINYLKQYPYLFSTDFLFNGIPKDILADPDLLILFLSKKVDQAKAQEEGQATPQSSKSSKSIDAVVTRWNQAARETLGVPVTFSGSKSNLRITIRCAGDENVKKILERLGIAAD
jgi:ParB family transcriptional regulator, chromosome partitioning protein